MQVCHALRQQNFLPLSYPRSEQLIWTDICRILFCQAFLYKEDNDLWNFDHWQIKDLSAIEKSWHNLRKIKVQSFFKTQWRFLEQLDSSFDEANVVIRRRQNLLWRLWVNYQKTIKPRVPLHGTPVSQPYKYYSYYNEFLSPQTLVIKKSKSILSSSDLKRLIQEMPSAPKSHLLNKTNNADDFVQSNIRYSDDGRSLFHRFYIWNDKKLLIERIDASIKEGVDFDYEFLGHFSGWSPSEPLTYYLDLLQCIDRPSIIKIMEDLLGDFTRPPKYYEENIKNIELNPWRWGMPDVIAIDKKSKFDVLLECKKPNDRLSNKQIKWLARNLERYNLNVGFVVVSEEQIGKL